MNEFLEQVWLDNKVKDYLLVAGVILFMIILKRLISRYVAGLLFKLIRKIWVDVDKKSFINLLVQPLGFFLLILVTIISLHRLNFPASLNVDVYNYTVKHIVHRSVTVILIISFVWLLLRLLDFIAMILVKKANLTPDQSDNQLIVFFRDFFKVLIGIAGTMMVLSYVFDVNVGSMITGLSIIGAAIALALRESLENLIASFIIFFDKPFTTGDMVKIQQITGTIEKIGLRSTRIRSEHKTYVTVPNKQMVDSILENLSLRTQRRADLRLEVDLQTSPDKLETLLAEIKTIFRLASIEEYHVSLGDISHNAVIIQADYYTAPVTINEFSQLKQEVNLQVLKKLEELKIEMSGFKPEYKARS